MRIELLYATHCPNWHLALERLQDALVMVDRGVKPISFLEAHTEEDAQAMELPGTPTIRVNGVDLFPTKDKSFGLYSRTYETPDGPADLPTVEQLAHALARCR